MKEERKAITIRMPIDDYKQLKSLTDFFGVSLNETICTAIHTGLIIANAVKDKSPLGEDIEGGENPDD